MHLGISVIVSPRGLFLPDLIILHMEIRRLRALVSFALADLAARRTFTHVTC